MEEIKTKRMIGKINITVDDEGNISRSNIQQNFDLMNIKPIQDFDFSFFDINNQDVLIFHVGIVTTRDKFELSYGTEKQYRCNGYATEGLKAVVEWLFNNTNESIIYALICNNDSSKKVLKKCGFSFESFSENSCEWYSIKK